MVSPYEVKTEMCNLSTICVLFKKSLTQLPSLLTRHEENKAAAGFLKVIIE